MQSLGETQFCSFIKVIQFVNNGKRKAKYIFFSDTQLVMSL